MIRYITILFCTLFIRNVYSQNLVPNGDFESYIKYPFVSSYGFFEGYINNWKSANEGSPDYYNLYSRPSYYSNEQNIERELPHKGNGFVGLVLLDKEYREYIQIKLKQTLVKDNMYCVSAYVTMQLGQNIPKDKLEFYFSKKPIYKTSSVAIKINPQIQTNKENYLVKDTLWAPITLTFKASDSFEYLTIGNFDDSTNVVNNLAYFDTDDKSQNRKYCFLDDVSIVQIQNEEHCVCKKDTVKNKGRVTVVNTKFTPLSFVFNEAIIKPYNYPKLDSIYNYLVAHAKSTLLVNGYTDNVGKETDNVTLSKARAKAVATYLTSKGIVSTRIFYKGYGSSNALNNNSTEDLKIKNRRAELIIKY